MARRDVIIGLIVLIILIVGVFWIKKIRDNRNLKLAPTPSPSVEQRISETFGNGIQIPDDVNKIELKDVSGSDAFGVATSDTVLADLPDPENGSFYQVWMEKDGKLTSLGKMRIAKGGWLYEGSVSGKVIISLEKVYDNKMETRILEGSF